MTSVYTSQPVPPVLQGSHLGLIHHSSNYGKPLVSRLGTCKFLVASRLAYKTERAGFYAQLNIDDSPCYSWWMRFLIRWCHCFRLLMRVENQVLPVHCRFLRRLIFGRQRRDLQTIASLQEAWINMAVSDAEKQKLLSCCHTSSLLFAQTWWK